MTLTQTRCDDSGRGGRENVSVRMSWAEPGVWPETFWALSAGRIKNIYKLWSCDGIKTNPIVLSSQQIKHYRTGGESALIGWE